jgi:hypothetical protein
MVDSKYRPFLLEVNHWPSLTCDSPLDTSVKATLVEETFKLLMLRKGDRLKERGRAKEQFQRRLASKGAAPLEEDDEAEQMAERERRRRERLDHEDEVLQSGKFLRVYPCDDPEKMALYQEILDCAAVDCSTALFTAASVQKQRDKVSSDPGNDIADLDRKQNRSDRLDDGELRHAATMPYGQSYTSRSHLNHAHSSTARASKSATHPSVATDPGLVKFPIKRQVQHSGVRRAMSDAQIQDQIAKHKNRMKLGPRVSVLQLAAKRAAAQQAAVFAEMLITERNSEVFLAQGEGEGE